MFTLSELAEKTKGGVDRTFSRRLRSRHRGSIPDDGESGNPGNVVIRLLRGSGRGNKRIEFDFAMRGDEPVKRIFEEDEELTLVERERVCYLCRPRSFQM